MVDCWLDQVAGSMFDNLSGGTTCTNPVGLGVVDAILAAVYNADSEF
jgi:hypothetical protein